MTEIARPFGESGTFRSDTNVYGRRRLDLFDEFLVTNWLPSVDVSETDGEISVKAELPGLDPRDIDVKVTGNLLTIKGEKKAEEENRNENYFRRERYSGVFRRSVQLPGDVKGEEAKARFQNGVLSITLPKAEAGMTKKVDIP